MNVMTKLRSQFNKRKSQLSAKLHSIPEQDVCNNNYQVINQSLEDLLEDELFLVPGEVLDMNSSRLRQDLSSIGGTKYRSRDISAPDNCLTLLQDRSGIFMARASRGCSTLWICKFLGFLIVFDYWLFGDRIWHPKPKTSHFWLQMSLKCL